MAGKSTISITFKLDGDSKSFKDLAKDADGLKQVITSTLSEAQQLKGNVINFAALATGIDAAQRSFSQLQSGMKDLADAYAVQEVAETKLATVMQQRMGATDAEIQSIKELASAQQEIGVIGDEVQLSGAQQIATFLNEKASLETLIPAMNNLLAQQKGLNASTGDAVQVGNLMGKAMMGQVDALKRVGISFTEAEANVIKYGTEQERAAMLAQVIQNNVGNMNAELAATDSGKQQQLVNTLGDMKEQIGGLVNGALPFVTMAAQASQALAAVSTLIAGIKTLTTTLYASTKAFIASTAATIKNKVATLAVAAAQKVVTIATNAWKAAQVVLNMILTANPIGLIITAIGLLVTAIITAYNNCESFRKIVDGVWEAIKPLANAIMNGLAKAFEWLVEKCKEAWEWLKNILGLGGKKVEVAVNVSKPKAAPAIDLGETQKKYANAGSTPKAATPKTPKAASPVYDEAATTLKGINDNIEVLRAKLQTASVEEAAAINQQIAGWQAKVDAIENAGKAADDNTPLWKEDAATLREIGDNIEILNKQLQTASIDEAAAINQQIDAWNAKADAIKNAGKAVDNGPLWKEDASTIKDISDNIEILNKQLQTASIDEAAAINQQIDAWNAKADAIKNAGREAEKTGTYVGKSLKSGWGAIKGMASSVESITEALKGNGSAWQIVCGIVDGFIGLYEGIQTVIGIINLLSAASAAHAATKGVEATAEGTEATVRATTAATNAATSAAIITANKLEAASWKELAAAEYMAAHAYIPFAGFGIAMGFTTAMLAAVTAAGIPMLADGGLASGPTLAMVGEYAGASGNPEVIAPLDKLRGLLAEPAAPIDFSKVEFRIKGRELVGILSKEDNLTRRS
ncbi:putative tail tape meassure protein [Bacteroides phage F4]|nr:putative tail tape meassure protein [Bacteroides phage F4]